MYKHLTHQPWSELYLDRNALIVVVSSKAGPPPTNISGRGESRVAASELGTLGTLVISLPITAHKLGKEQ